MQVYVDESGDPGLKEKAGTSRNFVIAAIIFSDDDAARACRARIRSLHQQLGWHPRQEFKFNKCDRETRHRLFETVLKCEFHFVGAVIHKSRLPRGFSGKDAFYEKAVSVALDAASPHLSDAAVVLDHCGSREFRTQMQKHLRSRLKPDGKAAVRAFRTEKSHACELLQLADMVAGAVARSVHPERSHADKFRKVLDVHELEVRHWP